MTKENYLRAARASDTIRWYKLEALGESGEADDDEDVIDLLTDLMHLLGPRLDKRLDMARINYEAEINERDQTS